MDIPESVFTASGAGSQCSELLSYRRGNLSKERSLSSGKGCLQRGSKGRGFCVSLWGEYRKGRRCAFRRRICLDLTECCPCSGTALFMCYQFRQGNNGHDQGEGPQSCRCGRLYAPGPMSRSSGTRFGKAESISTSMIWRISGNIAPGSTPKKRKTPPRRQRISFECRLREPAIWSHCRNLTCRSTRRCWWSEEA